MVPCVTTFTSGLNDTDYMFNFLLKTIILIMKINKTKTESMPFPIFFYFQKKKCLLKCVLYYQLTCCYGKYNEWTMVMVGKYLKK